MKRIVVDAMGGENAPLEIVRGAAKASLALQTSEIILVGDATLIGSMLPECRHDGSRIRVHHASEAIHWDEVSSEAIDLRPDASILVAAQLVAQGEGDAVVSAGNSGASILACTKHWQKLSPVDNVALSAVYPTELRRGQRNDPFSLVLDVGATADATARDLLLWAVMGAEYARVISKNERPRVALLANNSEVGITPAVVAEAHAMLRDASGLNFIGNIEGLDVPRGVADVVICSGYVGNVVVTMLEGVAGTMMNLARYAYKEKLMWRAALGLLSSGIDRIKDLTDWDQYGGAPLLGFDHLLIQPHRRSKAVAINNAIRIADKAVRAELCPSIQRSLTSIESELKSE
jgi:glycerol-3-phosphate acyltransferase PlsX